MDNKNFVDITNYLSFANKVNKVNKVNEVNSSKMPNYLNYLNSLNFLNFRLTFFLLATLSLTSCLDKPVEVPETYIPPDSMISILADVHIAESRLIQHGYTPNNQSFKSEYMKHVLQLAGVDSTRFNQSFIFYSGHPEYFHEMYEKVIIEVSKRQSNVSTTTNPDGVNRKM